VRVVCFSRNDCACHQNSKHVLIPILISMFRFCFRAKSCIVLLASFPLFVCLVSWLVAPHYCHYQSFINYQSFIQSTNSNCNHNLFWNRGKLKMYLSKCSNHGYSSSIQDGWKQKDTIKGSLSGTIQYHHATCIARTTLQ